MCAVCVCSHVCARACVCACVVTCVLFLCVSSCVRGRSTTVSRQPQKQTIWNERSCSLHVRCGALSYLGSYHCLEKCLSRKNYSTESGFFWYHFTPRKLLYHMISVNLVKFGLIGLSGFFFFFFFWGGATLYIYILKSWSYVRCRSPTSLICGRFSSAIYQLARRAQWNFRREPLP